MSATGSIYIDKKQLLGYLEEAKGIIKYYEKEGHQGWGSVDEVALRLIESAHSVFFTGIKLNGQDLTLHAREGRLDSRGQIEWKGPFSYTYVLKDFRGGTTISRFADSICEILFGRFKNPELAQMGNPGSYVTRTRRAIAPHAER